MDIQNIFPALGGQPNTKQAIISILSNEWPLSAKQLYQKVTKETNKQLTYQAVHKILNQLAEQQIILKHNQAYQLNPQWITQIKNFGQTIDHVYSNESGKIDLPKDLSQPFKIEFKDVSAYPITLGNILISKKLTGGKTEPSFALLQHGLWPLRFNFLDYEVLLRCAKANPMNVAIIGSLPFDKWITKQYLLGGFEKVKYGVKTPMNDSNFVIHGDGIIQMEYPPETLQFIEEIYTNMDSLSDLFQFYINRKISKHPFRAIATIQKNPLLAKLMKEKILQLLE